MYWLCCHGGCTAVGSTRYILCVGGHFGLVGVLEGKRFIRSLYLLLVVLDPVVAIVTLDGQTLRVAFCLS